MDELDYATKIHLFRQGIADGVFMVASNATDMPSHDFYDTVKDAVKEWLTENRLEIITAIVKSERSE